MEKAVLERAYQREKRARKKAEQILEDKARDIYRQNRELEEANLQLKQQQSELIQAEKGMALGTLVAGVIHEVNNPLAYLTSNVNQLGILLEKLREQTGEASAQLSDAGEMVADIREGLTRIQETVADLKSYAHSANQGFRLIDVAEVIDVAVKTALARVSPKPRLEVHESPGLQVKGNANELIQVVSNLLINAAQSAAMAPEVAVETEFDDGWVKIHVQDSGEGMSEEVLEKIFDPFFTTKEIGKGSGMGLPVVDGIIRKHGGRIEIETELGGGSLFSVLLPAVHDDSQRM